MVENWDSLGFDLRRILENCSSWDSITVANQDEILSGIPILAEEEMELKYTSAEYTGTVSDERMMAMFQHIIRAVHVGPVEKHCTRS